jgi:hypothetical protein
MKGRHPQTVRGQFFEAVAHLYVNIALSTHITPSPTPRTSNIKPNRSIAMTD